MLQVALEGVIKQVFVERQPEETDAEFEDHRISFPFAHQGESAQQRAERMQLDAKRCHDQNGLLGPPTKFTTLSSNTG